MNYLLMGTEEYFLKVRLQEIIKEVDPSGSGMDVFLYDGNDDNWSIHDVLANCDTFPLFGEKKLVVVSNPVFIGSRKKKQDGKNETKDTEKEDEEDEKNKVIQETLLNYLKQSNPTTNFVLVASKGQLKKNTKFFKALNQLATVLEFNPLSEYEFNRFVAEEVKARGIVLRKGMEALLIERLPKDLVLCRQELSKLEIYGEPIDEEALDALVSPTLEDQAFSLSNAITSKDTKKVFRIYKDFQVQNIKNVTLIPLLAYQFRFMFQVATLDREGYSVRRMMQRFNLDKDYRIVITKRALHGFSASQCLSILAKLARMDFLYKTSSTDDTEFEVFLLEVTR